MTTIIPVLLYHSVDDDPAPADRRWSVDRASFAAHARVVSASGRVGLNITELAEALHGARPLPERPVAITFDDGFRDVCDAVATLLDRDLASTLYITTSVVGTSGRLSAAELAELAGTPGVEVGAHAVRHRRLDEVGDGELAGEIRTSKAQLEDVTQTKVHSFAYPHGAYDRRVRDAVIAAGFRSGAAVKNAISHERDDPFAIARWTVTDGTPASRIADVLEGEGVPLAWRRERVRTRAYRTARRGRRALAQTLRGRH
jgi:peptidoglycan/xylan/chitin deacetylase (PgdA/CDA1 family)